MHGTDGVADTAFNCLAAFFDSVYCGFYIAKIIEGIEDSENINPDFYRLFDKSLNNIVRIMSVAHRILSTQQHLKRGFGHFFL